MKDLDRRFTSTGLAIGLAIGVALMAATDSVVLGIVTGVAFAFLASSAETRPKETPPSEDAP